MSYARLGDDSDVYAWTDDTYIWVHINPLLEKTIPEMPVGLNKTQHHRAGVTLMFNDRAEAYAMLGALCTEGVNVPGYVFTRLYDEMEDLGNKVGAKRRTAAKS